MSAVNWIVGFCCLLYPSRSLGQGTNSPPEHGVNTHANSDYTAQDATSEGGHQELTEERTACGTTVQALRSDK